MGEKILVVDDERTITEPISYYLEQEGYKVIEAYDGEEALKLARSEKPDLIILDIMLPKFDGIDVCRILRREMQTSIIMLTAKKEETDKVLCLEIGADDYVTKPFSLKELAARVKAVLRRNKYLNKEDVAPRTEKYGDLEINLDKHQVTIKGKPVNLRLKEYQLLTLLIKNKGKVLDRTYILDRIWGAEFCGDTKTVDVHVRWLREKIEDDPGRPRYVKTLRGVGYLFEEF